MPRRQTFLCSKGKGNSRGLPSPPRWGPARGPHLQLSLGGPRSSSAAEAGGSRRLATCTFETKQTRSPRAHPAAGHRSLSPRLGSLGADSPPKGPRTNPLLRTSRARAQRSGFTHTPGLTHPLSHAPGRRPLPRPAAPRNFPSCPRAPALVPSPPAPRTHLPRRLSGPRGRDGVWDGPAGAGGTGGARRVPAGSDTRLTARGWKAPRDLTSDPLSSHRARRTLPHRPEAETNFARSVVSYAHPRGRVRGAGGLRPSHAPEGAGPRQLLPAPTHLRNATWSGPGAERWDPDSRSQLGGRKWPAPSFGERFRSAYCVRLAGGGAPSGHKGCESPDPCKFVRSSGCLPVWGWGN